MLKHVATNNFRLSKYDSVGGVDTISLNSSVCSSTSSTSSGADTSMSLSSSVGEPGDGRTSVNQSRSSSSTSIHSIEPHNKVILKIYTRVLCTDVEYKTLPVYGHTTCKEIVQTILAKFRLQYQDPNLFYLSIETWIKQTGIPIRSVMTLDDDTCPALLLSCYAQKDLKFTLMMRRGSVVKVYDTCLQSQPLHKSIMLSPRTTVAELIELLVRASGVVVCSRAKHVLYEVCPSHNYCRKLNPEEYPLSVQADWPNQDFNIFQLRRLEENSLGSAALFNSTFNNFKQNLRNELSYNLSLHRSPSKHVPISSSSSLSSSTSTNSSGQSSDDFLYI